MTQKKDKKKKKNWNIKGWLKGEQGFIPDYKGTSTKRSIQKSVEKYIPAIKEMREGEGTELTAAEWAEYKKSAEYKNWQQEKQNKKKKRKEKRTGGFLESPIENIDD